MSIMLHAIFVLVVVLFALVVPPPPVVAPDRIKIVEINLKDVQVDVNETKLKNQDMGAPAQTQPAEKKADTKPPEAEKKPEPILKTVRVNREIQTLDRHLTVSVIDALRVSMTRCWLIDSDRPDLEGVRAVAHLRLLPSGRVQSYWFEEASRADRDPTYAYVFETIKYAIDACNPFSMLPRAEYEKWKTVQLTFYPVAKVIE